jgi:hypothetical protein
MACACKGACGAPVTYCKTDMANSRIAALEAQVEQLTANLNKAEAEAVRAQELRSELMDVKGANLRLANQAAERTKWIALQENQVERLRGALERAASRLEDFGQGQGDVALIIREALETT